MTRQNANRVIAVRARWSRRGSVAVSILVVLIVLSLVVVGMVASGARDQSTTTLSVQGTRTQYAADGAANMAIKELADDVDRDGDGAIGTISNDSNTATDPVVNGTRLYATDSVAGSTHTITARGENGQALRAAQVSATATSGSGGAGGATILMVTAAGSLNAEETAKQSIFTGWGYTVVTIAATASAGTFTTAFQTASVVYVPETVTSTDVGTKLLSTTLGVVCEEAALTDEMGISTSYGNFNSNQIDITSIGHYITSTFTTGNRTICTSTQPLSNLAGTIGGVTTLAEQVSSSNKVLSVMERLASLASGGSAAGRRVELPWGGNGFATASLNTDALTIMQRSIEWALLPVAYWKLDESSGTTAVDSISARNGTTSGGSWVAGQVNNGRDFNGSSDYISVADATAFQVTNALSIAAWVRLDSWAAGSDVSIILRKGDANPNNWQLSLADGRIELLLNGNDDSGVQGTTTLSTGTWYHVAGTWDGATVKIYLNGTLNNTPPAYSTALPTDTRPVYIGGRSGSTDVTDGKVDEVRFYNRALTAGEVAALASGGSTTTTVTAWKMIQP